MLLLETMSIISYQSSPRTVGCQGLGGAGQDPERETVCAACIFQGSADRPSVSQLLTLCPSTHTSALLSSLRQNLWEPGSSCEQW